MPKKMNINWKRVEDKLVKELAEKVKIILAVEDDGDDGDIALEIIPDDDPSFISKKFDNSTRCI